MAGAQSVGLGIKPAKFDEVYDPSTTNSHSVTITNLDGTDKKLYVFAKNVASVGAGGVPVFANSNDEVTGYEVADWIKIPYTEIDVPGDGKFTVDFTIDVPENATPGSHLGGLFFSVEPPDLSGSGAAVGYQVASIVSIIISGDVNEAANIRQFSTSKFIYGSQNIDFSVKIENTGNVVVRPVGPLEIFNMLGNKVGSVMFNSDRATVVPRFVDGAGNVKSDGTRIFNDIVWEGNSVGFGRYEAIVSPAYGELGAKKTMSSTVTFWILPMHIIGPALGVLAVLLLLVFIFVRLYIKRSLAHLNQGRRIVSRRRKNGSSAFLLVTVISLTVTALFLIVLLALFA
ncbi:DUF916 domain-containing protein [Candidatus Kaiserbacteria bacterium]|nr:DUF916 domain-containing protein [Candidatus Kaiserbacteria bacterium]